MKLKFNKSGLTLEIRTLRSKAKKQRGLNISSPLLVLLLAFISVAAWYFYYNQGLTLAYNDARSHLNVARRVFDSLQPGFAQLGSVWLPLYHILELPLIWNDLLWRSGLAGSLVSMASFILGGFYFYKLLKILKFDWRGIILALSVYSFNPNLLFMQTTPMTESLLIFLSIACVYHLLRWVKFGKPIDMVSVAFFTFLSSMTRYDGWFLLLGILLVVFVTALMKKGISYMEGSVFFFLTLAAFGIVLWFGWNMLIFGDPLYFILGPFSAKAQQDILLSEGRLLTKGSFVYSFFLYFLTVIYNLGLWVFLMSTIGLVYFWFSKKYSLQEKLAILVFLVPYIFNVVSLYLGHSVIHLPGIFPFTWFNDRYGLMVLPAIAVFLGYIVKRKNSTFILVMAIFIFQTATMYISNEIITIQDGVRGASGAFLDDASGWLGEHADDGLILAAASSNDALLFRSGIKLKRFITEGTSEYWKESLEDPTKHADWIIMHEGDLVEKNLRDNDMFINNYQLVYKDSFSYIYKLTKNRPVRLSEEELP